MAEAERKLSNGKSRIDFQTEPSRYRHWKLKIDGDVATLTMDVDEEGTLFEGYELKLNSRPRRRHRARRRRPAAALRASRGEGVVVTSGKDRVFCAGANIRMLAASTHAFKVNFCKFTNETRIAIEDATANSGQRIIAACQRHRRRRRLRAGAGLRSDHAGRRRHLGGVAARAAAARGAARHRRADPRGRQAQGAPRPRRRVLHHGRGHQGQARAVEWRLVDEVVPPRSKLDETVAKRARGLARARPPRDAKGIALPPLEREDRPTASRIGTSRSRSTAPSALATMTVRGPEPRRRPMPRDRAAGGEFWPLRARARARRRAARPALQRVEIGRGRVQHAGDRALVLACRRRACSRQRPALARARDPLLWKRVLKRIDLTARSSLVALIEPGSCFAGTLARARARRRPLLHADRGDRRQPPPRRRRARGGELRRTRWSNGLSRLADPLPRPTPQSPRARAARSASCSTPRRPRSSASSPSRPTTSTGRTRSAHRHRGARQLLARRAHRHGGQPALRRPRDDGDQDLRPPHRLAELDLPAPQRGRRGGALAATAPAEAGVRSAG